MDKSAHEFREAFNDADSFEPASFRPAMADWFLRAVELCYARPEIALKEMRRFVVARGQSAFIKKLAVKPDYFGRHPPNDGECVQRRREIRRAIAILPLLAVDAMTDDNFFTVAQHRLLAGADV
jgi:hypothetical protein